MPFPSTTKDAMLNGQGFDSVSLHTAFPGTVGANEVTGGAPAYARKTISLATSSGGSRLLSSGVTFDVPACSVSFLGLWNQGVFVMPLVNGGATPKNFVADPVTNICYAPGHGWADAQKIAFFGSPPGGLTEGQIYFTVNTASISFQVAATMGGAPIDITSLPGYGCSVSAIVVKVFATQDTYDLTQGTVTIPD